MKNRMANGLCGKIIKKERIPKRKKNSLPKNRVVKKKGRWKEFQRVREKVHALNPKEKKKEPYSHQLI